MQEAELQISFSVPQSLSYSHSSHKCHLNKAEELSGVDIENYVQKLQGSNIKTSTQVLGELLSELKDAVSYMEVPIQFAIIGIPNREGLLITHPDFSYPIEVRLHKVCKTVLSNLSGVLDIEVKPNLRVDVMYNIIQAVEKFYTSCSASNETPASVIRKGCLEYITARNNNPIETSRVIDSVSWV